MKLQFIEAGEIVTTHGIKGEVKVLPWLDSPEDLCDFDRCRIDGKEYEMESVRVQKSCNLVKLSGIDTRKVYFFAYTNMGVLAALAGILTIARMSSAQPTYGDSYEMDAIGSCFIGGASAYGGVGTVPGVIIGAVLMGVINLGMSIMGIDQNYQKVVKGAVLLAAVIFDVLSKKNDTK